MLLSFSTIGYGDSTIDWTQPLNVHMMIALVILGTTFMGFVIAKFKFTLMSYIKSGLKSQMKFENFENWLLAREMTEGINIRQQYSKNLKQYFNFYYKHDFMNLIQDGEFYFLLSREMRHKIYQKTSMDYQLKFYDFFGEYSPEFVKHIIMNSLPVTYSKGSVVIVRSVVPEGLYFLIKGSVDSIYKEDWNTLRSFKSGDVFGENCFIKKRSLLTFK